ncbi:MAG: hypothetical protein AB8U53_04375 [Rickettsia aeschlimannii]
MVVCFVTTIVLLITLSITFNAFITLFLPGIRGTHKYSTNEQYLKLKSYDKNLYEQLKGLPTKKLEDKRTSYKNEYIEVTKTHAVSIIINCSI